MTPDQQFLLGVITAFPPSAAAMGALIASLISVRRARIGNRQHEGLMARLDDLNARTLQLERVVAELAVLTQAEFERGSR